ncbi:MAG: type II toxin-antitoxin system VapC family toxin [Anaerolineales bacterium]|nr:type II toxin-antitoxin system VapC family toxin [Chloroflexota bacterium]MBL6983314.1 type II toxin-antitoxin system VapC family toxin [Anaerolineales bacterium]
MSITYLDTSALIKRYIEELGSEELKEWWPSMDLFGAALITRAEMAAALAKASRMRWLETEAAQQAWNIFLEDWQTIAVIEITNVLVERAGELAWSDGLRGYDAVHLAAMITWQDALGQEITLGTFDRQLWEAAHIRGMKLFPEDLPGMLDRQS